MGVVTNNAAPNPGGVPVAVETLRIELAARAACPVVVAPRRAWPGVRVNGCAVSLPDWSGKVQRLVRGFDLVHVQHPFGLSWRAARAARALGKPLVFSFHTRFAHYAHYVGLPAGAVAWFTQRRLRALARLSPAALAPTADAARELQALGFPTVRVLPWPAGRAFFSVRPNGSLRQLVGCRRIVLYAGRLAREKRVLRLVEEVSQALRRNEGWGFVLVGDGPERRQAERAAAASGLNGRIRFTGHRPHAEMPALVAGADVAVSASVTETQGLSLTEAQAAGVPVVTAAFPGAGEIVRSGVSGWVGAGPDGRLLSCLEAVLRDGERRRALSQGARAHAVRFHPTLWSGRLLQYYSETMDLARRRG